MTIHEAKINIQLRMMEVAHLMPDEWLKKNGSGSDFQKALSIAYSTLDEAYFTKGSYDPYEERVRT